MDPIRDLAFGFRLLAKRPAFTGASILALALGIGATVTIFSAVDALLLVLLFTSFAASYLPARRAGKSDPWAKLRAE